MLKTKEQLDREDAEFYKGLRGHVKRLKKQGDSPEKIDEFVYFYGWPPSACHNGTCNCPTH